tara:strand:+ start:1127 stop:1324 length:198 start_codon:yes stop_codon:yes gene_type:complete
MFIEPQRNNFHICFQLYNFGVYAFKFSQDVGLKSSHLAKQKNDADDDNAAGPSVEQPLFHATKPR